MSVNILCERLDRVGLVNKLVGLNPVQSKDLDNCLQVLQLFDVIELILLLLEVSQCALLKPLLDLARQIKQYLSSLGELSELAVSVNVHRFCDCKSHQRVELPS